MVIIAALYLTLVYLLFFRFKLLPWNKITQGLTVLIAVVILSGFLVGLQRLTPSSVQAVITGRIVEIAPQVNGRVTEVSVEANTIIEQDAPLFSIDPVMYEARVQELTAKLELAKLRLQQFGTLAKADAGTKFDLQQSEAEVMQLEAQLLATEFDLKNTVVRAPARGIVPRVILRPGMQVSSSRAVLTFVDIDALVIAAQVQQKAIENIQLGDTAMVNFPAFPGRVYEAKVIGLPRAIGDAQILATGQLPVIQQYQMTRLYPLYISIPEELPGELQNIGFAAKVYIHTEGAGAVGIVATILQWVGASLDLVM